MKETLSYSELQCLVEPDERSDHLAVTNIYLKELHAVARQNLVNATQESIAWQLAQDAQNGANEINTSVGIKSWQANDENHGGLPQQQQENATPKQFRRRKAYFCTYNGCNRKFKWLAHYRYHNKTHMGSKTYKCHFDNCNRSFYTPQSLAVHRRTHTGEKPFVCPEIGCIRSFNTNGNLKNHLRTHTGEKPYLCMKEGCHRRFAELSSLKKHLLVHSGQKPYSCDQCSKRFSQIGSRNVHKQRAHFEKTSPSPPEMNNSNLPQHNDLTELVAGNMVMMSDPHSQDMFSVQDGLKNDCVILSQPITDLDVTNHSYSYHSDSLMSNDVMDTANTKVLVLGQPEKTVLISSSYMEDYLDSDNPNDVSIASKLLFKN